MRARKAVITAAGRGTRQFPATQSIQKELLPLVDRDGVTKPTIQIIVEECVEAGIEQVCIVVARGEQGPFRAHFRALNDEERRAYANKSDLLRQADVLANLAERISYVEQPSPEGFGHAVFQARDFVGDEPFLLLLGDHVYTTPPGVSPCAAQLLDIGERSGNGVSVTSVRLEPEADISVTGIVKGTPRNPDLAPGAPGQTYDIVTLKEKPTIDDARASLATPGLPNGYYLGHFGLHLFQPTLFDCLAYLIETNTRVKNEIQLTSAQELLRERAARGEAGPYLAAYLEGTRWDIGVPQGYAETQWAYALEGPYADDLIARFGLRRATDQA
jgi:UTP--glucose-1-phosphate uridylyltransferase